MCNHDVLNIQYDVDYWNVKKRRETLSWENGETKKPSKKSGI